MKQHVVFGRVFDYGGGQQKVYVDGTTRTYLDRRTAVMMVPMTERTYRYALRVVRAARWITRDRV